MDDYSERGCKKKEGFLCLQVWQHAYGDFQSRPMIISHNFDWWKSRKTQEEDDPTWLIRSCLNHKFRISDNPRTAISTNPISGVSQNQSVQFLCDSVLHETPDP